MSKVIYKSAQDKTEEQRHYESLISLLKYGLSFVSIIVGVITTVAIWFTWGNVKDMKKDMKDELVDVRESYKNTVKDLSGQIAQLKREANETNNEIKDDAKRSVSETERHSKEEISRISSSTNQIALDETKKQLDYIFGTDKIQNLIQNQAVKEIKSKVVDIISEQTKNRASISDAASEARIGRFNGIKRLKNYFTNPDNSLDSALARQLYDQISNDYESVLTEQKNSDNVNFIKLFDSASIANLRQGIIVNGTPIRGAISGMMMEIRKEEDVYGIAANISRLKLLSGIPFTTFDIEAVYKWFDALKK